MVEFKVESAEMQKALNDAAKQIGDLRPALIQIGREFYKANKAIFALKSAGKYTDFVGPKIANTWKDPGRPDKRIRNGNYTAYQWAKEKATGLTRGYPLLKFSGKLESSITKSGDSNTVQTITKKSIVVGTKVPYGIHHQYGAPKANLPMRQFLFIDPSTTVWADSKIFSRRNKAWLEAIDSYVRRVVGESVQS